MKKTVSLLLMLALLLCGFAAAEAGGFELGHMEDSLYVNDEMGLAFEVSDVSGMGYFVSYAGDDLTDANGCAWNDSEALQAKLDEDQVLTCFAYGDASARIAGAINMVKITVESPAEGADDPQLAMLEEGKAALEAQAKENGYNMEKAEIGEMEIAGATYPSLSIDLESGGRHKQMTYVAILGGDHVYRISFDMDSSEVASYVSHFSAR